MKHISSLRRRYPVAFGLGLGIFLAASAAAAAFVIYTLTIGGSDTGQFAAGTTNSAVAITSNGTPPALDSGTTVNMPIKATNSDPNAQHKILTMGGTITTKNSSGVDNTSTCASFLTLGTSDLLNVQLVLGGSATGIMPVTAAAGTPAACAAGSYTVAFNGTTN
jgi:hypothetical protein